MIKSDAEIEDDLGDKIIGVLVVGALVVVQLFSGGAIQSLGDDRVAATRAAYPAAKFIWERGGLWAAYISFALLIPIFLVPGAFGVKTKQMMPTLAPRQRRRFLVVLIGVVAVAHGASAFGVKRNLGVATDSEAIWLRHGRVERRLEWDAASKVTVSCETVKNHRKSGYHTSRNYVVTFPNGDVVKPHEIDILYASDFADLFGVIDAKLRSAGVKRDGLKDPECIASSVEKMDDAQRSAFLALMAG